MTEPLLSARSLVVRRSGRTLLDGVDLEVDVGERVAIIGPSGSGKTSLLTAMAGLRAPDSGTVRFSARDIDSWPRSELRARMGVVFQGQALVSLLTAAENVELVLQHAGLPEHEVRFRASDALAAVGLSERVDGLVDELSGGEQQRVGVARALVLEPAVVLADEPTAELDRETQRSVLDYLFTAPAQPRAIVLVTHDAAVASRCERVLRLVDGRLVRER